MTIRVNVDIDVDVDDGCLEGMPQEDTTDKAYQIADIDVRDVLCRSQFMHCFDVTGLEEVA